MSTSSFNTWSSNKPDEDKWGLPGSNQGQGPVAPTTEDLTDPMDKNKGGKAGNNKNNNDNAGSDNGNDTGSQGNRMAGSDGFRNQLERNLGTKEYERIGEEGLQDADNKGRYSAAEVKSEYRNSGKTIDEMTEYFQGQADDGTKFNKRAKAFLKAKGVQLNNGGGNGGGGDDGTGGDGGTGGGTGGGGGGGTGGGSAGNGYGKNGQTHAQNAIDAAAKNNPVDKAALSQKIHDRPLYMQAQSDLMTSQIFGDIWSSNFKFSDWNTERYKPSDNTYGSNSNNDDDDD